MARALDTLVGDIRACRLCLEQPLGKPLPHEPRPVLQVSPRAKICIIGQAPGTKVHLSGQSFTDRSGDRLREWLGVTPDIFYDPNRFAIVPMGFCFPGQDAKGGDLPPRRECAPHWHARLFALLPKIELTLLVGQYAQKRYLGERAKASLTETVEAWCDYGPAAIPLPHPSWRNTGWLKAHPWFEHDLLPVLQSRVAGLLK
ncbi:MAG: uracil-DNA glycosylase family protein [Parvibaculum sp.]|nr:uracil-DNA glycosylase family protein [Parvibaculum sp.]